MIEPHWHWTFFAFDGEANKDAATDPTLGFFWAVEISITGRYTEEDARVMASSIVQREHYKLRRVYECTTCGYQEAAAKSMDEMAKNSK